MEGRSTPSAGGPPPAQLERILRPVAFENSLARPRRQRTPDSSEQFDTIFHGNCRKCRHWHDGTSQKVYRDPKNHTGIFCEVCGAKIFGLGGRRSTHCSLLSRESLPLPRSRRQSFSSTLRYLSRRWAPGVDQGAAPNNAIPSDDRPRSNAMSGPSRRPTPPNPEATEKPEMDRPSPRDSHVGTVEVPLPGRRARCLVAGALIVRRLLRIDVDIQVVPRSPRSSRTATHMSLADEPGTVEPVEAEQQNKASTPRKAPPAPERRHSSPRKPHTISNDLQGATAANSTHAPSSLVEDEDGAAAHDEEAAVHARKNDLSRKDRIKQIRYENTRDAERANECMCDLSCPCRAEGGIHFRQTSSCLANPGSRQNSQRLSDSTTSERLSSPLSQEQIIAGAGGHLDRSPHDSVQSEDSGPHRYSAGRSRLRQELSPSPERERPVEGSDTHQTSQPASLHDVVADPVPSPTQENGRTSLERMSDASASITTPESMTNASTSAASSASYSRPTLGMTQSTIDTDWNGDGGFDEEADGGDDNDRTPTESTYTVDVGDSAEEELPPPA